MQSDLATADVFIRKALQSEDFEVALGLIEQLAVFEKLTPPDDAGKRRFVKDGYERNPPRFELWLADVQGLTIGYVLLVETYSTFLCKPTLYLEDLFVLPDFRSRGIGRRLLDHCIALAKERGCGRIEWTCLDWNTRAQEVYERLGAQRMSEWLLYRLTEDKM
jgi:GNAT superfamily N-acetyltransferase